ILLLLVLSWIIRLTAPLFEVLGQEISGRDLILIAGGLNAALLTASLVYGQSFERTRRMWVRLADIEAMARKTPAFWQPRPDSLLEGDDYFRRELVEVLAEGGSGPGGAPGRVDLLLTA